MKLTFNISSGGGGGGGGGGGDGDGGGDSSSSSSSSSKYEVYDDKSNKNRVTVSVVTKVTEIKEVYCVLVFGSCRSSADVLLASL